MFTTGGTAIEACNFLKSQGVKKIKFISILATLQGLKKFSQMYDDVEVFVACIDEGLNEKGYIIPGDLEMQEIECLILFKRDDFWKN